MTSFSYIFVVVCSIKLYKTQGLSTIYALKQRKGKKKISLTQLKFLLKKEKRIIKKEKGFLHLNDILGEVIKKIESEVKWHKRIAKYSSRDSVFSNLRLIITLLNIFNKKSLTNIAILATYMIFFRYVLILCCDFRKIRTFRSCD